uniref:Micro-fibrillar-associated protein 1 C-terminal domain-containing protein n=1 Tax=Aceria tosichella TaxID=561515 RepID=A0A6G1SKC0_9ACAR
MPSNKSAAVPFINQKGEWSMKKVKVERYVAGKKPTYAEGEEEEYYTTDDEDKDEDADEDDDEQDDDDQGDDQDDDRDDDDDDEEIDEEIRKRHEIAIKRHIEIRVAHSSEIKQVIYDDDEDENEDEIRRRHELAKNRQIEIPAPGTSTMRQDSNEDDDDEDDEDNDDNSQDKSTSRRLETDDLLKDLKLTGISRPVREKLKTTEDEEAEAIRLKEMIEQAKQEASFTRKTYEKINQDIKREEEKEALAKGDIGAREMSSVNTDDEDEELAYDQWKLREIQRVVRDRSERMLATR